MRALAINQLAGVLADLHLIRPLTPSELKRLGREETRSNMTNLRLLEEQHAVLQERRVHIAKRSFVEPAGEIDPKHFGTQRWRIRLDLNHALSITNIQLPTSKTRFGVPW